jgi:ATP synthase protein I
LGIAGLVSEEPQNERLKALEARLSQARARAEPEKPHMEEHYSQAQLAWRMVVELVAGLGIGFGIGYGLDILLGTQPWLMVVFTLLGFIAGVKTMIRSAQEVQRKNEAADAARDDEKGT